MRPIVTVLVFLVTLAGCNAFKSAGKAAGSMVVDCTKGSAARTVAELGPLVESTVIHAVDSNGKVDWRPVKDLAHGFTADVGGCVLASAIAKLTKPLAHDPSAPQVAGVQIDQAALARDFAELKTELFAGVTFKTANGEI